MYTYEYFCFHIEVFILLLKMMTTSFNICIIIGSRSMIVFKHLKCRYVHYVYFIYVIIVIENKIEWYK